MYSILRNQYVYYTPDSVVQYTPKYSTEQSVHPNAGIKRNSLAIGKIIIGIIIGGVIVYIFKDDIEAFLNRLANKSSDKF